MKKNIEEQLMWNIYRKLYANSTPSADFDELVANATTNERGQKEIDFMAYEIDNNVMEQIIKDELKTVKYPKWRKEAIRRGILLGCSPKSKVETIPSRFDGE